MFAAERRAAAQLLLIDGRQGRLSQWAHWARAQGPRIFFLFEGPPTGCGEINRPTVKGCSCAALR